jgi:hypothetical protein
VTALFEKRDDFALVGDVPLRSPDIAFCFFEALLQGGAIHTAAAYQPGSTPGPFFCPWIRFSPRLAGRDSRPAKLLQ